MKRLLYVYAVTIAFSINPTNAGAEEALMSFKMMTPETALKLAQAALADCRKRGFQTSVAVVDRFGGVQVLLRDRLAGNYTVEVAQRKAWTAAAFRMDTLTLANATAFDRVASAGIRQVTNALMVGGGIPIEAAGSLVGAVAVSGAAGGKADDECARAGINAIADDLAF